MRGFRPHAGGPVRTRARAVASLLAHVQIPPRSPRVPVQSFPMIRVDLLHLRAPAHEVCSQPMSDRLQHIHDELARRRASWARKWRRVRWSVRIALGVPLLLALLALVLMRSPVVGWMLSSQVRRITGCEIRTGGAWITLNGSLVIRDFALVAPGVNGEAAEFLSAPRAWLDLDWSGLLTLDVRPVQLRLLNPRVLLSQSQADGRVNIASLASVAGRTGSVPAGGSSTTDLPTISIIDGSIVFAEHSGAGDVRVLKSLPVAGSFSPSGKDGGTYLIRLQEVGRRGMLLDGRVDLDAASSSMSLLNVSLKDWSAESVPRQYRELWRALNIQGEIASTSLYYDKVQGPRVGVVLRDVAMNALIPSPRAAETGPAPQLSLSRVKGRVDFTLKGLNADLEGVIEGQRGVSKVRLTTTGLSANSALSCEISARRFDLTKDPEFLPYVPERAREYFQIFSGPTGEIDVRLVISRGAPNPDGSAADVQISGGRVGIRNGTAAFHRFPYPFHDIDALCEFDDDAVRIVSLEGKGPTGARMRASGIITPLDDTSMIDVYVHAENVPVDEHLLTAMPLDRRRVLERLFHRPSYERLVRLGLIRPLGTPAPTDPLNPSGLPGPSAPEFVLAGPANVDVHVHSPRGRNAPWFTTVDIAFDRTGLLLEAFPLPIIAEGMKVRVTDDDATLLAGSFQGLSGGTAEIVTKVVFRRDQRPVFEPDIRIQARSVPIDELLLHTLPGGELPGEEPLAATNPTTARESNLSAGRLIRALGVRGTLDAIAIVGPPKGPRPPSSAEDDAPDVDYQVDVSFSGARAAPAPEGQTPAFSLQDVVGGLRLTRERLEVQNLQASLFPVADAASDAPPAALDPERCAGTLRIDADVALSGAPPEQQGGVRAVVDASTLDLEAPFEQLVAIFAPEGASRLVQTKERFRPAGRLHARLVALRPPGQAEATRVSVRLENASDLAFNALGGRIGLDWISGGITVDIPPDAPTAVAFDTARLRVGFDGAHCGELALQGGFTLDDTTGAPSAPGNFTADMTGWVIQSQLVRSLIRSFAGPGTLETFDEFRPSGVSDATLLLRTPDPVDGRQPGALRLGLELRPKELSIVRRSTTVGPMQASGALTLSTSVRPGPENIPAATGGALRSVTLSTGNWSISLDGDWNLDEDRRLNVRTRLDADALAIDPGLAALLPVGANAALARLEAKFNAPVTIRDARLTLGPDRSGAGGAPAVTFDGVLACADAAFNIGLTVDRINGALHVQADDPGGVSDPRFQITARASALRVTDIQMHDALAVIQTGLEPDELIVPEISARAHGGVVSGAARAFTARRGPGGSDGSFELDLRLSGVRLAPVLANFASSGITDEGPMGPPNPFEEPDPSRGVVDARLVLSGVPGQPERRTGFGAIRISDGDVLKLPVILPLMQLSNLQIPRRDRLSLVETTLQIDGPTVLFDDIQVRSRSIEILGGGTLMLPDLSLDMTFNSRGSTRVPLLSGMFEALRNEIVTTRVRGTLSDPSISSQPFVGTRALLSDIFEPSSRPRIDPVLADRALDAKRELQRQAAAPADPPAGR